MIFATISSIGDNTNISQYLKDALSKIDFDASMGFNIQNYDAIKNFDCTYVLNYSGKVSSKNTCNGDSLYDNFSGKAGQIDDEAR